MQVEASQLYRYHKQVLFDKRLQIFGSKSNLQKRMDQNRQLQKKYSQEYPKEIKGFKDIERILQMLNMEIYNFRFSQGTPEKVTKVVKGESAKKKNTKENQKLNYKLKKFMELFNISKNQELQWKKVLRFKNVTRLLEKVYCLLFDIIENNLQLLENTALSKVPQSSTEFSKYGFVGFKDKQLNCQIRILIAILVMDILRLIETVKVAFFPYTPQEQNKLAEEQLQDKKQLQKYFQTVEFPENFVSNYKQYGRLSLEIIHQSTKVLAKQLQHQNPEYILWINIQDLKRSYITEQKGILKKKSFCSQLQKTIVNQLNLYWLFYSNQYRNSNLDKVESEYLNFYQVFKDYDQLFQYLLQEAAKEQNNILRVINFFDLILGPWRQLDRQSALKIFWEHFLRANEKNLKFPQNYIADNLKTLQQVCKAKIELFWENQKDSLEEQLSDFLLTLSKQLVNLEQDQNLKTNYFEKNKKDLYQILKKYRADKLAIHESQAKASESINQNILESMKTINKILNSQKKDLSQLDENQQDTIFEDITNQFEVQQEKTEEIINFLFLANSRNLEECRKFYKAKREQFSSEEHIQAQSINNLRFGLIESIKITIFELISTIKLEQKQSLKQNAANGPSQIKKATEKLQILVYKLLRIFQEKTRFYRTQGQLQINQIEQSQAPALFAKRSALKLKSTEFQIQDFMINKVQKKIQTVNLEDNEFTMKLLKKIFQIKIQVIQKRVLELEKIEAPLKAEYCEIKQRVYNFTLKNYDNPSLKQYAQKLPLIEYQLTKKRFWPAWRKLTQISDTNLIDIQSMLEQVWAKKTNILKLYVTLLIKYRQLQDKNPQLTDISENQVLELVNSTLKTQKNQLKSKQKLKQELKISVRMLSNFQELKTLKKMKNLNYQTIKSIQQSKQYQKTKDQGLCFRKWLDGKVSIIQIWKHGVPITMKYTITPQAKQYDSVLKKIQKLAKLNRNIIISKEKQKIYLHVDQHELQFQSYPKLVKYLLESYFQTVQFCQRNLHLDLYPLVWSKHIKIQPVKQKENHLTLRFNPYQGILLQIFLDSNVLMTTNFYKYPQFPFVQLAEQLSKLFTSKVKVYTQENQSAEQYAFLNLIQQMKALSLEQEDGNFQQTYKQILKCPYFWSSTEKFYQLVQFKEKYHNNINIEECRRKQNQRVRAQITEAEYKDLTAYLKQKEKKDKHPLYRTSSNHNRTTQVYYSIEGLIQRQAFEEDVGNFREKNASGELKPQPYKYHTYWWSKDKNEILYLLELVSQRQKKKGSNKASVYQKTFNSFQNQIRNLRNLACHYIYDSNNNREISIQQKISLFQENFPKLFVFIYRWKPFLGKESKDFNVIRNQKIKLLCSLFPQKDNTQIIERLQKIKQLQDYNIQNKTINKSLNNQTTSLLQKFKYIRNRVKNCNPCSLITMILYKQDSFWAFLADAKYPKEKDGKIVLYNAFFWDHHQVGCNGMHFLQRAFYNVSQRNQFTVEELSEVSQVKVRLKEEKQRLQRRIQKLQKKQQLSDDQQQQGKQQKENVEARYRKLTQKEKQELHEELALTDYVCKYFIFQLQMTFPYLFHDLRRFRHLWDNRAKTQTP